MSRVFGGAANLKTTKIDDSGITSYPCTIAAHIKITTANTWRTLFALQTNTSGGGHYLGAQTIGDGLSVRGSNAQDLAIYVESTDAMVVSTWQPVVIVYTSTGVQVHGLPTEDEQLGSQTYQATDADAQLIIGSARTDSGYITGKIAHFTIWDVELSGSNISSFLNSDDPSGIDALNQTRYWAFTDASLTDSVSSEVLTNSGTTSDTGDNPSVSSGSSIPVISNHLRMNND